MTEVVIAGAARTPVGTFNGAYSTLSASDLGEVAIRGALERAQVEPSEVSEVILGQILSRWSRTEPGAPGLPSAPGFPSRPRPTASTSSAAPGCAPSRWVTRPSVSATATSSWPAVRRA